MSHFLEDLWNSVFTPGPTPTLLVATNVTFAALLLLLVSLLVATYSIHFLILSVLASSLWLGINWFAREVQLAQAQHNAAQQKHLSESHGDSDPHDNQADGSGEDTETENQYASTGYNRGAQTSASNTDAQMRDVEPSSAATTVPNIEAKPRQASSNAGLSNSVRQRNKQRHSMTESTGSLSTDSEWERVEDDQ